MGVGHPFPSPARYPKADSVKTAEIQAYLKSLNGQGTVPHVYINQEFIGGASDLQKISQAELKTRIARK